MSIEANILGRIDNRNVQVEINSSKGNSKPNYYKVPKQEADAFITDYKKSVKRNTIISNIGFVVSILGGTLIASAATKKMQNTALKWVINIGSGIGGAIASIIGCSAFLSKAHESCLKRHNAEQIEIF